MALTDVQQEVDRLAARTPAEEARAKSPALSL
jgi:hypothetical protein